MSFLPGQIFAKGTIEHSDGKSFVLFSIQASWRETGVLAGSQFTVATMGDAYPHVAFTGKVISIEKLGDVSYSVKGAGGIDGRQVNADFVLRFDPQMVGIILTGGANLITPLASPLQGAFYVRDPI